MTVFIHYTNNPINFAQLLVSLQPQLNESDDIYIVDSSSDREGFRLAKLYGSTRSVIFIEVGQYTYEKALAFGIENELENGQDAILVISQDAVISNTFISNVRRVIKMGIQTACPIVEEVPYPQFPGSFKWYNPVTKKLVSGKIRDKVFVLSSGKKVGVFAEETVLLLPTPKLTS